MGKRRHPHPSVAGRQSRPQAVGACGAPHLPFGFASKPSPSAPWARGLLSAFWERGSPDLPACSPQRGSAGGPVCPIFTNKQSRPSRGAKPREAGDTRPPQEWPHQVGSRGAERSRQGTPREVRMTQAMTTGARRATARSVLVSSLVLKGQVQTRRPEASGKGFHISATRPRPAGRRDGGHRGAQDGVTTRAFGRRRLLLLG